MYKVLIVDDESFIADGIEAMVPWSEYGMEVAGKASDVKKAFEIFNTVETNIVITDVSMPGMTGLEMIKEMKIINPDCRYIIISGYSDFKFVKEGLKLGVDNYLTKPINKSEFFDTLINIKNSLDLNFSKKDQETGIPNLRSFFDENVIMEPLSIIFVKHTQYDSLRNLFGIELKKMLKKVIVQENSKFLDSATKAYYLRNGIFALVSKGILAPEIISEKIKKMIKKTEILLNYQNLNINNSFYFVYTASPVNGSTREELYSQGKTSIDFLCKGRINELIICDADTYSAQKRLVEIEIVINQALAKKEMNLVFQPKYANINEKPKGFEALLRWNNSHLGVIPPDLFINVAEKSNIINDILLFTIRESCQFIKKYNEKHGSDCSVAVNFSFKNLIVKSLIKECLNIIKDECVKNEWIVIEITETCVMELPDVVKESLMLIEANNIQIHLDDFGTGFSSLNHIFSMNCSAVKIDKTFIQKLTLYNTAYNIVKSTIDMTHSLGMINVAEGVETQTHYDVLKELGCDLFQGYFFSKPLPEQEWLKD